MEANGGSQWPEDYGIAMVVSSRGLVAWVPAQALAQYNGRGALVAAVRQKAWVPAEAAARTGWIPPPGMLLTEDRHALAVALRHGWAQGPRTGFAAVDVLCLACLYLPAQEVARTRRVCRLWHAKSNWGPFRLNHRNHHCRTPMPLFRFVDPGDLASFNLRAVDIRGRVSSPVIRCSHGVVKIYGSCAGILLVSLGECLLYFCNPCARRWAVLPPLHANHDIIGFYARTDSTSTLECNVLYHDRRESPRVYGIFTIATAATSYARPSTRMINGLELDRGVAYHFKLPPVLVLNLLHWLPLPSHDSSDILRFDTVAETFSMIPPPSIQVGNQNYPVRGQLFEMDQHLAMASKCPFLARVDVWVRSNTTELWSLRYMIPLPVHEINLAGIAHDKVRVFAVAQDRNVLVCCPRILLQCDARGTCSGDTSLLATAPSSPDTPSKKASFHIPPFSP